MGVNLSGRNFLKLLDFTPAEIRYLLDLAKGFKDMKRNGVPHDYLRGKNIVLLFEKTSTRTRCSFEVAGRDLGMGVTYLDPGSSQMGKKESIEDTARVLGRMYDGIEYRGFAQSIVEDLAANAGVPVWNGLTTEFHPTQMLADIMTAEENFGNMKGEKLVVENGRTFVVTKSGYKAEFTNILPEYQKDQEVILSVRPEEFLLNPDASAEGIGATVDDCVFLGLNTHYFVHLESGEEVEIIQESSIDSTLQPGTKIKLTMNTSKVNIFTADGSANILTGVCNDCV